MSDPTTKTTAASQAWQWGCLIGFTVGGALGTAWGIFLRSIVA